MTTTTDKRCRYCGASVTFDGFDWIDETGEAFCEFRIEGCGACEDGEPHPHEAER